MSWEVAVTLRPKGEHASVQPQPGIHGWRSVAGDHFDPTDAEHGFIHAAWSRGGSGGGHGGDLPNIYAASGGTARADFFTVGITLDEGPRHSVFDADGSAIIVHERPDSYGQYESDTGTRVACGVIMRDGPAS